MSDYDVIILYTMQVQHSLSDSKGFSPINREFWSTKVTMQCNDGFVLKRFVLCSNLKSSAICDKNILCLQLNICFVKDQLST